VLIDRARGKHRSAVPLRATARDLAQPMLRIQQHRTRLRNKLWAAEIRERERFYECLEKVQQLF